MTLVCNNPTNCTALAKIIRAILEEGDEYCEIYDAVKAVVDEVLEGEPDD